MTIDILDFTDVFRGLYSWACEPTEWIICNTEQVRDKMDMIPGHFIAKADEMAKMMHKKKSLSLYHIPSLMSVLKGIRNGEIEIAPHKKEDPATGSIHIQITDIYIQQSLIKKMDAICQNARDQDAYKGAPISLLSEQDTDRVELYLDIISKTTNGGNIAAKWCRENNQQVIEPPSVILSAATSPTYEKQSYQAIHHQAYKNRKQRP